MRLVVQRAYHPGGRSRLFDGLLDVVLDVSWRAASPRAVTCTENPAARLGA